MKQITHLEHFEDLMFKPGYFNKLLNEINYRKKYGREHVNYDISIKIDGSPAIYFGNDPIDNKFFISTKSLFNKTPVLIKSKEDCSKYFSDEELINKMEQSFYHLSKLSIENNVLYHGDYLFGKDDYKIEGNNFYYTPNVITYCEQSEKMKNFNYGIALHTCYEINVENGVRLYTKIPYCKVGNRINKEIYIKELQLEYNAIPKGFDVGIIQQHEKELINKIHELPIFLKILKQYLNSMVNDNFSMHNVAKYYATSKNYNNIDSELQVDGLMLYNDNYWDKEINKLKTDKGKLKKTIQKVYYHDFISKNWWEFIQLFNKYYHMIEKKYSYYNIINNYVKEKFKTLTYVKDDDKLVEINGEGFVISYDNMSFKLVDRTEFTKINNLRHKRNINEKV